MSPVGAESPSTEKRNVIGQTWMPLLTELLFLAGPFYRDAAPTALPVGSDRDEMCLDAVRGVLQPCCSRGPGQPSCRAVGPDRGTSHRNNSHLSRQGHPEAATGSRCLTAATGSPHSTVLRTADKAVQSQQLADLIASVTSLGRAQTLDAANSAAAKAQAREQLRRFLAPGRGYVPTTAQMFRN